MIYTVTLNPARDRTVIIPGFAAGKVNRVASFRDDPGGKGINVSKVVKSLGGNTVAMGILGGATGRYIKKSLDDMEIENRFVFTRAETRTNIKVYDSVSAETTDINEAGHPVSARVMSNVFARIDECVKEGDVVVFAGKIPTGAKSDTVAEWVRKLNQKGVKTVLDADSKTLYEGVKAGPYMIKPNETELGQLLGRKLDTLEEIYEGAKQVIDEHGVRLVAVSLGADGALFVTANGAYRAEGLKITVMSTVGAGDAMTAALSYGMDTGMGEKEAYALSIASSAACVMKQGTQSASLDEIKALYEQVKIEKYA